MEYLPTISMASAVGLAPSALEANSGRSKDLCDYVASFESWRHCARYMDCVGKTRHDPKLDSELRVPPALLRYNA